MLCENRWFNASSKCINPGQPGQSVKANRDRKQYTHDSVLWVSATLS